LARFESYAAAAAVRASYQLDALRAHLDSGLDLLASELTVSGQIDNKDLEHLRLPIVQSQTSATTAPALIGVYRAIVTEIERTLQHPARARQSHGLQRALDFMREHLSESLTLPQVARVAGFAPRHFSRLVKREQSVTFEHHLQLLRLERAKYMLATTSLSVERVARAVGFKSRTYFQQLFKRQFGKTPIEHRDQARLAGVRKVEPRLVLRRAADPAHVPQR
jgi:YesN/AraC family two-component response regulator